MTWAEPENHCDDCYFCVIELRGLNSHKKRSWVYPTLKSVKPPVPHNEKLPIPKSNSLSYNDDVEMVQNCSKSSSECDFQICDTTPPGFSQGELNDLIRDLNLPKIAAELLASRLREKHCLQPDVSVSVYRNRESEIVPYFSETNDIVYCSDIAGLLAAIGFPLYKPEDWRLFIDSSKKA